MRVLCCLAAAALVGLTAAANLKELDDKNFAASTENRNSFIMLQAPW